jgi:hypothetical protein
MTTDLTFFTNEPDATLLDRFRATLRDVQFFDVLVGYFRTSGFHLLVDALEGIEEIRILVGLGVDRQTLEIVEASGQHASPRQRPITAHREQELNALVYDLYGLTEDEIAIIEGSVR